MNINRYIAITVAFCLTLTWVRAAHLEQPDELKFELTLAAAASAAVQLDPWLQANKHQQQSMQSMSIASGSLPDPRVSVSIANLATDTFNFNQEPMTQFKVGVSQMLPRGDSLEIKKREMQLLASEYPFQRENRKAQVTVLVSKLWLDAYKAQQSINLIEQDRALFEQLVDLSQASYASALGKTRQQDIVRAQLELTRLDDRLTMLKQQKEIALQQLSEWLNDSFVASYLAGSAYPGSHQVLASPTLDVAKTMPNILMLKPDLYRTLKPLSPQTMFAQLSDHPAILAAEQRIKASKSGIDLARQNYKPEWGFNASYAYRDADPLGQSRADFFTLGVSFDIPLFTENRQDKQLQAAVSKSEAVKTKKWMLARQMIAAVETARSQLNRLSQRQTLYQQKLLPQMHDQAESSLTAYTNDDGEFAEVIRSRIAELNATIDALDIDVERQKSIVQLNYYFMKNINQIIAVEENKPAGETK